MHLVQVLSRLIPALRLKRAPELPLECYIVPKALGVVVLFGARLGEYDGATSCE
jgi:hypothetical protein